MGFLDHSQRQPIRRRSSTLAGRRDANRRRLLRHPPRAHPWSGGCFWSARGAGVVESEYDPTVSYISADLMVRSERLTADELIAVIGMEPDEQWTKGGPRSPKRPESIHNSSGVRFLSDLPTSASLVEQVDRVLSRLEPVAAKIGRLPRDSVSAVGQYERSEPWVHLDVLPIFREPEARLRLASTQVSLLAEMGADFDAEYCWWMPEYEGNGTIGYGSSRSRYKVSLSIPGERIKPNMPLETTLEMQLDWFLETMEPTELLNAENTEKLDGRFLLSVAISSWQDESTDYLWILPRHFDYLSNIGAGVEISFEWDREAWSLGQFGS
jgi:hypothetical protein